MNKRNSKRRRQRNQPSLAKLTQAILKRRDASLLKFAKQPKTLIGAIERERIEQMQVMAMLKCLYQVLLYADDDDSILHADVANVCSRLLDESIVRMDSALIDHLKDRAEPANAEPTAPSSQRSSIRKAA